ncbi:MAG: hypothetical protein J0L67_02190 [Cytophagales bacterium]|nr:hypothetical protein [Cytophagales bacterium]
MSKVALIIIFNHKFEKNLPALKNIYQERFEDIYFVIPFYAGSETNVIPVYDHSYYFQGYIAQALKFISHKFDHYLFIADDLFLNPAINQSNYSNFFKG